MSNIIYPCGFSAFVISADFAPEFVIQGTTVWVVFSFVNGQHQSTQCVPFNVHTEFNSQVNNTIPRPKSGPAYLLVTVAYLSPKGNEMRPIGRGRIKVENLRTGDDSVNTMDIPHAEQQTKILCKLRFTCRLTPPAAQMPPAYSPQPGMQPQYPPQYPYGVQIPPYGSQGMNPQLPPQQPYNGQGMNGPMPPPPAYPQYPPQPGAQPMYPTPPGSQGYPQYPPPGSQGYPQPDYGSGGGIAPIQPYGGSSDGGAPMPPPPDPSNPYGNSYNSSQSVPNPYYNNTNPYAN